MNARPNPIRVSNQTNLWISGRGGWGARHTQRNASTHQPTRSVDLGDETMTREELYELVWSKPITKLAADLGMSDVGLSKLCRRHDVPTPPRGHWARREAGYTDPKVPLPKHTNSVAERIAISATLAILPEGAQAQLARAKEERKGRSTIEVRASVPTADLHAAIRKTADKLRAGKVNKDGVVEATGAGMCGVVARPADVERVVAILAALVPELEKKEIAFTPEGKSMRASRGPDAAVFRLIEILHQEVHVPTADELAAEDKRQKRLARERGWSTFGLSNPRAYPDFDWVRKGQFTLSIDSNGTGARRNWSDGKNQSLEKLLPNIVAGFDIFLIRGKAQREEQEERSRQWNEMQRRQGLARQRTEREKERLECLGQMMAICREIVELEQWLANTDASPNSHQERFMIWARQRLARLRAQVDASGVESRLTTDNLFPDPDPLDDPLGEPPRGHYW